jgi:hypothetical protein
MRGWSSKRVDRPFDAARGPPLAAQSVHHGPETHLASLELDQVGQRATHPIELVDDEYIALA